jgi:hypothetical protein
LIDQSHQKNNSPYKLRDISDNKYMKNYYFIKKTGELVVEQKIPYDKTSKMKGDGIYVRILLGSRSNACFFLYRNQCRPVLERQPLTPFEISCLRGSYQYFYSWTSMCSIIKKSRGNSYPDKWIETLRQEKIIDQPEQNHFNKLIDDIIENLTNPQWAKNSSTNNDTNSSKSVSSQVPLSNPWVIPNMSFFSSLNSNGTPNMIFIPKKNDSSSLSLSPSSNTSKKNVNNDNNNNNNNITFSFQEYGGISFEKVDYITRVKWDVMIDPDQKVSHEFQSIYLGYPFPEITVDNINATGLSKKDLLRQIIDVCISNKEKLIEPYEIDDIGLSHLEIHNNDDEKQCRVFFLY